MQRVGFVGLGMMGAPMAANVMRSGFPLTVFDLRREAADALAAQGATAAAGLDEVAACEIAVVMVNTDPQAREVIEQLVERAAPRPRTIVSMSTILPSTIRELGARAVAAGIGVLDAPVSGGPVVAQLGALAIMVGGERLLFDEVRPLLDAMGRAVTYVGPLGSGLCMKLVNNTIAISTLPLVVEALRVGLAQGLALPTMVEVIRASSGNTWVTDQWEQARLFLGLMLADRAQLESLVRTGLKDLQLASSLCGESSVDAPLLHHAIEVLERQDLDGLRSNLATLLDAAEDAGE